jgi:hypothetical protein
MHKLQYSTREYDFASIIKDWLDIYDLEKLHDIKKYELFSREQDQSTRWHKVYYDSFRRDATFQDLYESFLKGIIKPRYKGEDIVYQKIPTFRVHLSGNIAVGEWHKDKAYRKDGWADLVKETNYYLPFTDTNEENTIWTESEEDKGDFSPMLLKYGECMEWDGSNLMHGNKVNGSDQTRVSVDFRVMPYCNYHESNYESINTKTPFKIGGYYDVL